ncbi:MAG: spermidine synthase [Syntrophus sp. SKADARSKE-3]|nr:spermidine synthase [Syntrophus sp. SKADARSKE-3]
MASIETISRCLNRPSVAILLATGLISLLGQVALLRELNVAFYGTELIYVFSLGFWLIFTAAGAIFQHRLFSPTIRKLAAALVFTGPFLFASVAFIRGSRIIFSIVPGVLPPFGIQLLLTAITLFPVSFMTGILFSGAAKAFISEGRSERTLSAAYAIESIGALAGGLIGTLGIYAGLQNIHLILFCFAVSLSAILFLFAFPDRAKQKHFIIATSTLFLLLAVSFFSINDIDRVMTRWNHPHLLASRDTPYGRVTLSGLAGQVSLFENDALTYETDGTDAEAFVHTAALQHPEPMHILIMGSGSAGLVRELLRHHPERIDYIELNPSMLDLAIPHLPSAIQDSLHDRRVRLIIGDPRQYLTRDGFYDLIFVAMPEPASGQTNRFYSREFFQLCATRLKQRGIVAFRLKSAENFWTPLMTLRMGSIYQAIRSVYPECVFLPGTTNVVTASFAPLPLWPDLPIYRLRDRHIKSALVTADYLSYLYENDRFLQINSTLEKTQVAANTDKRPICYRYSILLWLAKFFPAVNTAAFPDIIPPGYLEGRLPFFVLFIATITLFLICRAFPMARYLMLMVASGAVGMVFETVLLLYYQIRYGVLYQDMAILLSSFMAGLASGALSFHRLKPQPIWGFCLASGFFCFAVIVYRLVTEDLFSGLIPIMVLFLADGLFVSAVFSYTSHPPEQDQPAPVSPLYGADLLGGALGAVTGGLYMIPFLGLDITAALMIIINAAIMILV